MISIRTTTDRPRRLRPDWASGLAAAISRRTREAEARDAVAREARAFGDALQRVAEAMDRSATAMAAFGPTWRRAIGALNREAPHA